MKIILNILLLISLAIFQDNKSAIDSLLEEYERGFQYLSS